MNDSRIDDFVQLVGEYYAAHGRHDLPWRLPKVDGDFDPYCIVVSELMLQQTQVSRVLPKFAEFITAFPSFAVLAAASLSTVLQAWSGLGYNRRAKFLWQTAQTIQTEYGGRLPSTAEGLTRLPGIGSNTAGAILAYAYNQPVVFVETNIRTVFIHHFFANQDSVTDKQIIALLQASLDVAQSEYDPRQWYWALMDYGTHLKKTAGNASRSSATYSKQSAFHGSRRQIRGQVLRLLGGESLTMPEFQTHTSDNRLSEVLRDLEAEGLIERRGSHYQLTGA
jgi:A/G-specific adenine glycosylase